MISVKVLKTLVITKFPEENFPFPFIILFVIIVYSEVQK